MTFSFCSLQPLRQTKPVSHWQGRCGFTSDRLLDFCFLGEIGKPAPPCFRADLKNKTSIDLSCPQYSPFPYSYWDSLGLPTLLTQLDYRIVEKKKGKARNCLLHVSTDCGWIEICACYVSCPSQVLRPGKCFLKLHPLAGELPESSKIPKACHS